MGLRGPQPKPTAVRELEGNPSGKPLNKKEPKPKKVSKIEPPEWMDETAKKYWNRAVLVLSTMRVLTEADLILLERYCDFLSDWKHCRDFLKEAQRIWYPIYDGDNVDAQGARIIKYMQEFPHVSKKLKFSEHLLRIEMHFGMTPASRSRIIQEENNPLGILPEEAISSNDIFDAPDDDGFN